MTKWNKTPPPKNKTFIGICPDCPWATIMVWCDRDDAFVYAAVQASGNDGMEERMQATARKMQRKK